MSKYLMEPTMVVRLADLPTPWATEPLLVPDSSRDAADYSFRSLPDPGQLLLKRASSLAAVTTGGRGIPGIKGEPLHLLDAACLNSTDCFISNRVFAVIAKDGSMCLRLPAEIADDLLENGLCIRAGKNLLTWPIEDQHQLEVAWRILLHAYWHVTSTPRKRARRLLSEWVINH